MSLLNWLFGRSKYNQGPGIEQHLDYLNSLRLPAISLVRTNNIKVLSRIGGLPSLPDDIPWPKSGGKPLSFLCQINLAEIPADCDRNGLPPDGMLYFFYTHDQDAWGYDPNDKGCWHVIYSAAPEPANTRRDPPDGTDEEMLYGEKPIALESILTYPNWSDDRVEALNLTDKQSDQYCDLCANLFGRAPAHHLFGYADPVQNNDMDLESQIVSNGLNCGGPAGFDDPRAKALEPGRHDWLLLLQLDTDNDTSMMWGDGGMLYFWIRKQDLAARRFENCWMILQCY